MNKPREKGDKENCGFKIILLGFEARAFPLSYILNLLIFFFSFESVLLSWTCPCTQKALCTGDYGCVPSYLGPKIVLLSRLQFQDTIEVTQDYSLDFENAGL